MHQKSSQERGAAAHGLVSRSRGRPPLEAVATNTSPAVEFPQAAVTKDEGLKVAAAVVSAATEALESPSLAPASHRSI
jgi:hypothetical protein